jgi:hypothetical protein
MADGSPFLDGLFSGFAYLQVAGATVRFSKTLNLAATFTATYNAATNAIDINVLGPSPQIPISDDGAGTVSIGNGSSDGLAVAFVVPNGDSTGEALRVDNATSEVVTPYGLSAAGVECITGSYLILREISAGAVGTPATGFAIYVDSADHKLKAKGRSGTVTSLANP